VSCCETFRAVRWWQLCTVCRLSSTSHAHVAVSCQVQMEQELRTLDYRCPYCVDRDVTPCLHGRAFALDLLGKPLGPTAAA
jgi:predicted RNA-binding Zn-ribbon protein involved in translation (DUF1610 family)